MTREYLSFEACSIVDYVVILPDVSGDAGRYTMVTRNWSPAMLEGYNFSSVGTDTQYLTAEEERKIAATGVARI